MKLFFVLIALIACECVHAASDYPVRYKLPDMCEWTLRVNGTYYEHGAPYRYVAEQNVNGLYVKFSRTIFDGGVEVNTETLLSRMDLSNSTEYDKSFETHYSVGDGLDSDIKRNTMNTLHYYRSCPLIGDEGFPTTFDKVEETTCDGKKCKKYSTKGYDFYTDMDDIPISAAMDDNTFELEFVKEAPLSLFKIGYNEATFGDIAVYKAPKGSICYSPASTSSMKSSEALDSVLSTASIEVLSSFVLILSIFAVLLNSF